MVRRTKEQALATRELLLDTAQQVFLEKGVARATLDDIARAAKVTRGAIYWHFRNKAELFAAMCDRVSLPMQAMLDPLMRETGPDPLGRLKRTTIMVLQLAAEDPRARDVFEIMFFKCDAGNPEIASVLSAEADNKRQCIKELKDSLDAAIAAGQLPAALDSGLAAEALNAFVAGLLQNWLARRDFDLAAQAPVLVDMLFQGFAGLTQTKRPPPSLA
ncbi:TetR family transcriptional regulator [Parachitinimonas caeni]|uniref:TetR family transcriptional regulator n=1 Tax=Parachitinimonas caeni TaxID=3031301 RepID=A0ABT7DT04_9NEIS|nr:TetR family transcriptional regulator [Parachitinimonas caeni]MDK2122919.1 TetR family transcriptional regulator [Parachitinimonas caeni]